MFNSKISIALIKFLICFLGYCFFTSNLFGQQPFPEPGVAFEDSAVSRIDILIHPDSLYQILKPGNEGSDHEYPAVFIFNNGNTIDTIENIGFRLRGNTSRYSAKKSFKVSFNTFDDTQKFHGLEKMNLNGEHNDPSIARSKICWEIIRDYGIIGSRTSYVQLYINQEYRGLYINVEHVDEEYVNLRFGNKNGNLYKCLWPAPLTYLGSDPDLYKYESGGRRAYDLKTNTEQDDYSDLAELVRIINITSPGAFPENLEPIFNVNAFLKFLAIEVATGHWDSYSYNQQNYYLYNNTASGQFEFIPYDVDNTFGIDWMNIDWGIRDIYQWGNMGEPRPLTTNILSNPEYRNRYSYYLKKLVDSVFNENFIRRIDSIKALISPYAETDLYRTYDYGYDFEDFLNSFEEATGAHVKYGIKPYLEQRKNSIYQQLQIENITPIIGDVTHNFPVIDQNINFEVFVEDDDTPVQVNLKYKIGQGNVQTQPLINNSVFHYSCTLAGLPQPGYIDYYIEASDPFQHQSRYPRTGWSRVYVAGLGAGTLKINELLASNLSYGSDESNDYDDWIEILNYGSDAIFLGDKFLTDNQSNPDKWQFPQISINPGQFLLLWADDEMDQGQLHTNFKLDKGGEYVGIYQSENGNFLKIDEIAFGQQETDVSFGRIPDATGAFTLMSTPSPGYPNSGNGLNTADQTANSFRIYPNPSNGSFRIQMLDEENLFGIRIFDLYGRVYFETQTVESGFTLSPDMHHLASGAYIITITVYENGHLTTPKKYSKLLVIN